MMDIKAGMKELGTASDVHLLSLNGEMKEMLWHLHSRATGKIALHEIDPGGTVQLDFHKSDKSGEIQMWPSDLAPETLFLPSAGLIKSGRADEYAAGLGLFSLAKNSFLYSGDISGAYWPGRHLKVQHYTSFNPKQLRMHLRSEDIRQINVISKVPKLKRSDIYRELGIKEGGEQYLIVYVKEGKKKAIVAA
jgi:hypothetical protein